QFVIRSAVTQTIARPNYQDLVPREIVDVSGATYGNSVQLPNMDLRPLESVNYDLSMDYYFKHFGYVSLGLFYKDLDGPIYTEVKQVEDGHPLSEYLKNKYRSNPEADSGEWTTSQRLNAGKGKLYGVEIT